VEMMTQVMFHARDQGKVTKVKFSSCNISHDSVATTYALWI